MTDDQTDTPEVAPIGDLRPDAIVHAELPTPVPLPEPDRPELTDLERVEQEYGFTFGTNGDTTPPPTLALICRNPECTMNGQHVAVHHDTAQPITCGGLITTVDGSERPCGAILRCDHEPITTEHTEGTFGAPIRITTTKCTKCGTVMSTDFENLPPVALADLPIALLDNLGTTPNDGASQPPANPQTA